MRLPKSTHATRRVIDYPARRKGWIPFSVHGLTRIRHPCSWLTVPGQREPLPRTASASVGDIGSIQSVGRRAWLMPGVRHTRRERVLPAKASSQHDIAILEVKFCPTFMQNDLGRKRPQGSRAHCIWSRRTAPGTYQNNSIDGCEGK